MFETYLDFLRSPAYTKYDALVAAFWCLRMCVFPALVSILFVRLTIGFCHRYDVLARPSDRGSHSIPTPRLGGIGSAGAFYVTCLMLLTWEVRMPLEPWRLALFVGGGWALIGGALDDFQELPPRWKLLLQLAACGSVAVFAFTPTTFDLPFGTVQLGAIASLIVTFIVTLFMMNIFNFMDGMDGQASVFGIITGLGLAAYIANHGLVFRLGIVWDGMLLAGFAAAVAATLFGLLMYNYPGRPASSKTFLGDCGSQFYGFVLAIIALQAGDTSEHARFPWLASLILFSPFIYDVAYTLVRRMRRGEKLTQAHRTHLYQRLMVAGWTHGQTLVANTVLYICAVLLAWGYAANQGNGVIQVFYLLLTGIMLSVYTIGVIKVEQHMAKQRTQISAI